MQAQYKQGCRTFFRREGQSLKKGTFNKRKFWCVIQIFTKKLSEDQIKFEETTLLKRNRQNKEASGTES